MTKTELDEHITHVLESLHNLHHQSDKINNRIDKLDAVYCDLCKERDILDEEN